MLDRPVLVVLNVNALERIGLAIEYTLGLRSIIRVLNNKTSEIAWRLARTERKKYLHFIAISRILKRNSRENACNLQLLRFNYLT